MRIHRLHLQNWGQHRELELEFPPTGVISLTGPNNSGKSTLLSAIGWVLSPTSRNRYGSRNDIQDGQTRAAVTLEFTLEDNFHQPTRHILRKEITVTDDTLQKANPETRIELNGSPLTGPQWEDFLKQHAQLDEPAQFLSLMIAPQEEIHALLRSPPGTRNKELRESLGIALPDFWNETLKEELNQWTERYAQRAGAIERALADSDTRLLELHRANETLQLQLGGLPQTETILQQIAELDQWIQQLKAYQVQHSQRHAIARDLLEAQKQKDVIRAQRPSDLPPGDLSGLDLRQIRQQLRLLTLAECQQKANAIQVLLENAAAAAQPPWPAAIEEKKELSANLQGALLALAKRIIQKEIRTEQIEKLKARINPQYAPLENDAPALERFYPTAIYHTTTAETIALQKVPLRNVQEQYYRELEAISQQLQTLEEERDALTQQHLDPFTGTEAAATLLRIWHNRTPDERCILTGSDLSHLNQKTIDQKTESFRILPFLTGNAALDLPAQQKRLERIAQLNLEINNLQNKATQQKTVLEPLIQLLESLPSEKWLKISIEAIGTCLSQITLNRECRRQIEQLQQTEAYAQTSPVTTLEKDKEEQALLQRQKDALDPAIELQVQLNKALKELNNQQRSYNNPNDPNPWNIGNVPYPVSNMIAGHSNIGLDTSTPVTPPTTTTIASPITDPAWVTQSYAALLHLPAEQIRLQIETLDRVIRYEEETREKTAALEQKINLLKSNLAETESACAHLKAALDAAQIDVGIPTEIPGLVPSNQLDQLQTQKKSATQTLAKIQQCEALKAQNQSDLEKAIFTRQQLQAEEQRISAEKLDLHAAKEAADFFGPKRAPKQLLRAALQEIVEETNRILPETGLEMELSVSPEMDFQVSFERGQNRITEPARRLGCGLATLVGMCLKMALARILQPNLKFLAFDEPSAQLDPLKKEAFAQFLKSLSQQALTGNQVLVIEHDLGIAQSCDHQIRLT